MDNIDTNIQTPPTYEPPTPSLPVQDPQEGAVTSSLEPKNKPKTTVIIITALFIIIGGVISYILLKQSNLEPETSVTPLPSPIPGQESGFQLTSVYVGSNTTALSDVSEGNSSGSITRELTLTTSKYSITASLPELEENSLYQAWTTNSLGSKQLLGTLSKQPEGKYSLEIEYSFPQPRTGSFDEINNIVLITRESVDDNSVESIILQGEFKK